MQAVEKKTVIDRIAELLILYSDGSYERVQAPVVPACSLFQDGVATADITVDPAHGTWARIFMPQLVSLRNSSSNGNNKLPVVLHFHGGGFCVGSPSHPIIHNFCSKMALLSSCIWISVDYRLAPEHRLPAAYDDAFSALLWLHSQATLQSSGSTGLLFQASTSGSHGNGDAGETLALQWLNQYADFSKTFLAGESAGGTIAHFAAARASTAIDWEPLCLRGVVLVHPGFKAAKPVVHATDASRAVLTQSRMEFYHRSALPEGAEWDHPFINPMHPQASFKLSEIELPPVLVAVAEEDPLCSGGERYYKALKEEGKPNVQFFLSEHVGHCFHLLVDPSSEAAAELLKRIAKFIQDHTSSSSVSA